jgi:hypothetical protein
MAASRLHFSRALQDLRADVAALRYLSTLCPAELAGLHDVDYRTKTFSCSVCGSEAYFCLIEPTKEFGMHEYRLDEIERPGRHPAAVKRLTEPPRRAISIGRGELPGRKIDGRR